MKFNLGRKPHRNCHVRKRFMWFTCRMPYVGDEAKAQAKASEFQLKYFVH